MRFVLLIMVLLCGVIGTTSFAADVLTGVNFAEPIEITSQKLEVLQNEQKTVFSGQVEARQNDFLLTTDLLTVFYDNEQNQIARLEAEGQVRLVQLDRRAQADHAVFKQAEQVLVLSGHALLQQGANQVAGEEIVFDLANNTSTVKSSGAGRVKATILPPKKGSTGQ